MKISVLTSILGCTLLAAATTAPSAAGAATIYECVNKQSGGVRVVSPTTECASNESSVILNIPEVVHGSVISGNAFTNGVRNFTVKSHPQAGQYVIGFDALESSPDCVFSIINPPLNNIASCVQTNTTLSASEVGVSCRFYNPATNTFSLQDADFSFICML